MSVTRTRLKVKSPSRRAGDSMADFQLGHAVSSVLCRIAPRPIRAA